MILAERCVELEIIRSRIEERAPKDDDGGSTMPSDDPEKRPLDSRTLVE